MFRLHTLAGSFSCSLLMQHILFLISHKSNITDTILQLSSVWKYGYLQGLNYVGSMCFSDYAFVPVASNVLLFKCMACAFPFNFQKPKIELHSDNTHKRLSHFCLFLGFIFSSFNNLNFISPSQKSLDQVTFPINCSFSFFPLNVFAG